MPTATLEISADGRAGPRTLASAIYMRIRRDIVATRFTPGQKLNIAALAEDFSVSLAAVREALCRLVADGLVIASDQRGFRVSPISRADLADVTQTRIEIEGVALRKSIERGDDAWLASVRRAFDELQAAPYDAPDRSSAGFEAWNRPHHAFHHALIEACGSPWLLGFCAILNEQSERYRRLSLRRETGETRDVDAEHTAIATNVLKRDADKAVAAMACHYTTTMRYVELALPRFDGESVYDTNETETQQGG